MDEDLFALFDLPLDCDDTSTIERAIKVKQAEWSASNDLRTGEANRYFLSKLGTYRQALLDREARRHLRDRIRNIRQKEIDRRERNARRAYELMVAASVDATSPYITEDQRRLFLDKHSNPAGPTRADLIAMIKVPVRSDEPVAPESAAEMDTQILGVINSNLKLLGKEDLYEFLSVPRNAPADTILERAKQLHDEWSTKRPDPAKASANKCLGFIETLLTDPVKRAQYDSSLKAARIKEFLGNVRLVAEGKAISAIQVERLVLEAEEVGLSRDEALSYIRLEAKNAQATLETAQQVTVSKSPRCGHCGATNSETSSHCASCKNPLNVSCPKCGTTTPSGEKMCRGTKCGLTMAEILAFSHDLKRASELLADHKLGDAQMVVDEVERRFGQANSDLRELKLRLQEARTSLNALVAGVQAAHRNRHLITAAKLLDQAAKADLSDQSLQNQLKDLREKIDEARKLAQNGVELERSGNAAGAEKAFLDAHEICSDLPEAIQGLASHPPKPPANVKCTPQGSRVRIEWTASTSPGVDSYRIVRKKGGLPENPNDGAIKECRDTQLDDLDSEVGAPLFYAVYSVRGGAISAAGRVNEPVHILVDLDRVDIRAGDGHIVLSWEAPPQPATVRIVRNAQRPPASPRDGQPVTVTGNSLTDSKLQNGMTYYYGVYCAYRIGQEVLLSKGLVVSASPAAPPTPLKHFEWSAVATGIRFGWIAPPTGEVVLVRSAERLNLQTGSAVSLSQLDALGTIVRPLGLDSAQDDAPLTEPAFYTAFTKGPDTAVVGLSRQVAKVNDASGVRLEHIANAVQAFWRWPEGSTIAIVAWRPDRFPLSWDDPAATRLKIGKAEFDRNGRQTIPVAQGADCFFTVYAGVVTETGDCFAGGQNDTARASLRATPQITISYSVKRNLLGKRTLYFRSGTPCTVTGLVLVAKRLSMPTGATDGIQYATPDPLIIPAEGLLIDFPAASKGSYVKACFNDDALYDHFHLIHPNMADLKVA